MNRRSIFVALDLHSHADDLALERLGQNGFLAWSQANAKRRWAFGAVKEGGNAKGLAAVLIEQGNGSHIAYIAGSGVHQIETARIQLDVYRETQR